MRQPKQIELFATEFALLAPGNTVTFDAPSQAEGTWWIDIVLQKGRVTLSWSSQQGFGFYSGDDAGFGERPSVCYADPVAAAGYLVKSHPAIIAEPPGPNYDIDFGELEKKVLHQIAQGRTNKEIARQLHLPRRTVQQHLKNMLNKIARERMSTAAEDGDLVRPAKVVGKADE